jgi:hypothetical protein
LFVKTSHAKLLRGFFDPPHFRKGTLKPTYRYKSDQVSSNLIQLANFRVADNTPSAGTRTAMRRGPLSLRPARVCHSLRVALGTSNTDQRESYQ